MPRDVIIIVFLSSLFTYVAGWTLRAE